MIVLAYYIWGIDCVKKFNGMFSFAIFDEQNNKLTLARDRAGEKPLFYYFDGTELHFSSELKSLMSHPDLPKKIDRDAFDCYLAMGYVPKDRCMLENYNKLPAGHILQFDLSSSELVISRYWMLPEYEDSGASENELIRELEVLLDDSVNRQLVADVPVGILLSGGVDSSILTAIAAKKTSNVKTFTIGIGDDKVLDETLHARLIASHFGTEHTELQVDQPGPELLLSLAKQFDEPINDSSMIPTYLVSKLVSNHCSVVIGGDGGDELFGGYSHYSQLLGLKSSIGWLPPKIRSSISKSANSILPCGVRGRSALSSLDINFRSGLFNSARHFDIGSRKRLMSRLDNYRSAAERITNEAIPVNQDLLQRATRNDFLSVLADAILVKVDRCSMLNSVEVRAPFLDHRVIEFAFSSIPSSLKADPKNRKILLKKLGQKLLPPDFDFSRKQGFSIPLNKWLEKGSFRDLFCEVLLANKCSFDQQMVSSLLKGQDSGRSNSERLFSLLMFELWRTEYKCHF